MNRIITLAIALVLACASQADRERERAERAKFGPLYAEVAQRRALDRFYESRGEWSHRAEAGDVRSAIEEQERVYRAACQKCASAEKCEDEIRRIRSAGAAAANETACP